MNSGTNQTLWGIWGASNNDVFTVGGSGYPIANTILHYNGSAWSSMHTGTTANLNGVWGSSGNDVFAVGKYGTILYYSLFTIKFRLFLPLLPRS